MVPSARKRRGWRAIFSEIILSYRSVTPIDFWKAWSETLYVVAWAKEYAQHIGRSNFFGQSAKTG